jgi:hypothetical protein
MSFNSNSYPLASHLLNSAHKRRVLLTHTQTTVFITAREFKNQCFGTRKTKGQEPFSLLVVKSRCAKPRSSLAGRFFDFSVFWDLGEKRAGTLILSSDKASVCETLKQLSGKSFHLFGVSAPGRPKGKNPCLRQS